MSKVFLAPVPAVHLQGALDVCNRKGMVAFGSGSPGKSWSWEFFSELMPAGQPIGMPAYIYVSATDLTNDAPANSVEYTGILDCWKNAELGKHPDPAMRPPSALNDGDWQVFWEVADLAKLSDPLALSAFRSLKNGEPHQPIFMPPRRPTIAFLVG